MKQGWVYKKFSEVFNLQMGKTPSRDNNSYWGGDNVWVSISDLKGKYIGGSKEHITDLGVSSSGITKVPKGTAIMSFKLTIGRAAIAECDLYTNEAIMSFAPLQKDTLLADYIYYYLRGCKWTGANKAVMGQTLNKKTISENIFAYPSIDEQKAICSLLDKMNRVIEAKKEQLKELDNLAQAIFYDMFGDPVTNEKGWKYCKLADLIAESVILYHLDGNHGGDYPRSEEFVEVGVPYIGANAIINGDVDFSMAKHLTNERAKQLRKGIAKNNDVLFAHNATVGPVAILKTNEEKVILSTSLTAFRCNEDRMSPYFLKSYMKSEWFVCQYKGIMKQATRNQVPITKQKEMLFILPPLPLQQSFAEKVEAIERQKELINQSIKDVQTLFDAKMDYYFGD